MAIKRIALGLLAALFLTGQTGPLFNSAQIYEVGTCSSTASTCVVTLNNSYPSTSCYAADKSSTNTIRVTCAVSGNTLTITTAPTVYASNCAMSSAATCTFTSIYSGTEVCAADNISATTTFGYCSASGTTVTVTSSAPNSNTWHTTLLYSSPAPTASHTYAYIVVQ